MRKKEQLNIGGKVFDVVNGIGLPNVRYSDIKSAYDKPSISKQQIWSVWVEWFNNNSTEFYDYIGVSSRNTFMFTICGRITTKENKSTESYCFYITQTRQEIWVFDR